MSISRPFAYNTGSSIPGTEQVGDLAVGWPTSGFSGTGLQWWNGPDEETGYVIAKPVPSGTQPTQFPTGAYIGFSRTSSLDDNEFIALANSITNDGYTNASEAAVGLQDNGYWSSYLAPVLSLDAGNVLSYPGTGTTWTDLVGGKTFSLINGPGYDPGNGGKFYFYANGGQYAQCNTSLPYLSTWSIGVWHYYDGTNVGSAPCIVTENYPGITGQINYSLGDNNGGFSSGFFDGSWRVTDGYSLTSNNWYYIVGTYDGTDVKLYVNNTLVDVYNSPGGNPISSQGGIRLMRRWDLPDYWGGYLAKVDIYDRAISSTSISSIWNGTKSRFGL